MNAPCKVQVYENWWFWESRRLITLRKHVQLMEYEHKVSTNASVQVVSYALLGQRCMGKGTQTVPPINQLTTSILSLLRGIARSTAWRNFSMVQHANHSTGRNTYIVGAQDFHTSRNHFKITGARIQKWSKFQNENIGPHREIQHMLLMYPNIYTECFTTLGHNCRRWFPRSLWSKKFI